MNNVLHLTLKKKWFDMIRSGEKTEEYREIKPYWIKRLAIDYLFCYVFKDYTHIQFRHGYASDAPIMLRRCLGIEVSEGKPEWGAEPGKKYFVIKLG